MCISILTRNVYKKGQPSGEKCPIFLRVGATNWVAIAFSNTPSPVVFSYCYSFIRLTSFFACAFTRRPPPLIGCILRKHNLLRDQPSPKDERRKEAEQRKQTIAAERRRAARELL